MIKNNISIEQIKAEIKLPILSPNKGVKIPLWSPFLDVVNKIDILDVQEKVRFKIMTLIISDGLSFRKLDLSEIRNYLTQRNSWKVSIKSKANTAMNLWTNVIDISTSVAWVPFLKPAYKFAEIIIKNLRKNYPNQKMVFDANLSHAWKQIWNIKTHTQKWNSVKDKPKWFDEEGIDWIIWKPVLLLDSDIWLNQDFSSKLHFRYNIPIWDLSRDHAKNIRFVVISKVMVILDSWLNVVLKDQKDIVELWSVWFESLDKFYA